MKISYYIPFFIAICFFYACGNRPSNVLSEKQMEDVLYDLYIADSEIKQNQQIFRRDSLLRIELLQSVFEKHKITEQKFDTSLVWYNANLDKFIKINDRLKERYTLEIEKLRQERDGILAQSEVVDSTFVYFSTQFFLTSLYKQNIFSFEVKDPDLLTKDNRYYVDFLAMGIKGNNYPVLTFHIESKDTTFIFRDTIKNNSWHTFTYTTPTRIYPVSSLYGSFYLPAKVKNPVVISDLAISQQRSRKIEANLNKN